MINRKIKIISIAVVLIIVFILMYLVAAHKLFKNNSENDVSQKAAQEGKEGEVKLPTINCDGYATDQDAYKKAIETPDVSVCECVKNDKLKSDCKLSAIDAGFYLQALRQYNPEICNEIVDESRKEACITVTNSGVKNLSENDPQLLANLYSVSHNEKAIEEYEALIQADPKNVNNLLALAVAYAEKGLSEQEQGRDQTPYVEKALATVEKAKELEPNNSEVYRIEGYAYEIKPDIAKAIESYDKAIELDPKNSLAYASRGHANSIIGILGGALEDFQTAAKLDINNENIFIYANLCRLESSRDDLLSDAIRDCGIVADGNFYDSVFKSESIQTLALIYMKNREYSQAESYLLKAKSLTPNDPNLYATFSRLSFSEEDFSEAQFYAEKAISLSPTKAASYLSLANALYMQENFEEAIQKAQKGVDLVKADVSLLTPNKDAITRDLYYTIAHSYRHLGDEVNQLKYMDMAEALFAVESDTNN